MCGRSSRKSTMQAIADEFPKEYDHEPTVRYNYNYNQILNN